MDVLLLWRGSIRVAFDAFPIMVHELQAVDTMYSSHAPEFNTRRSRNIDVLWMQKIEAWLQQK